MCAPEWRDILDGQYAISSFGDIVRKKYQYRNWVTRVGKTIKRHDNGHGYMTVCLYDKKKRFTKYVHRLVAEVFIGPCPKGEQVNHKDGNKANNCVGNLEYVTRAENAIHAFKTGLHKVGEAHHNAKLSNADVENIRDMRDFGSSITELANAYGITRGHIWSITTNRQRIYK